MNQSRFSSIALTTLSFISFAVLIPPSNFPIFLLNQSHGWLWLAFRLSFACRSSVVRMAIRVMVRSIAGGSRQSGKHCGTTADAHLFAALLA